MKLNAIVTTCTPTTRAMVAAATNTPIVMASVSDPIGQGLIVSYRHPGGRITGTASQFEDMAAKMFQLLHEAAPNSASIAVLFNANNPVHKIFLGDIENAAQLLSLKLVTFPIGQPDSIDTVIEQMRSAGADAVMVLPDDPYLFNWRHRIADKLNLAKLPSMFGLREAVEDGGLMSYGESPSRSYFRAAHYVDHIVTGTPPADMPVEQPTKFELVINLNPSVLLRCLSPIHLCLLWARSVHCTCPLFGVKRTFIQGRLSVPSFSGGFAWRKRRLVAGTSMNNSIFHAKTLQTKVFRSARRLVEIEKYFVHRIPTAMISWIF